MTQLESQVNNQKPQDAICTDWFTKEAPLFFEKAKPSVTGEDAYILCRDRKFRKLGDNDRLSEGEIGNHKDFEHLFHNK